LNLGADRSAFAGAQQGPPVVDGIFFEEEQFKFPAGFDVHAAQPRRDHAGIVQHQNVAGLEKLRQLGKLAVFDFSGFPLQHQQARTVAARGGLLRDESGRQVEMEIGGSHRRERNGAGRGLTIHCYQQL